MELYTTYNYTNNLYILIMDICINNLATEINRVTRNSNISSFLYKIFDISYY